MASAKDIQIELQKMTDKANKEGFKFNREEAATARNWQTQMSNTSHQREVKDLMKAGLNPVLSVNQGAQSYTTSAAQAQAQNAASAVAGLYESEWSAQATKKAARLSAAATRAAAAASAAATRYASEMNFAAAKYQSDMQYKTQKAYNKSQQKLKQMDIDNPNTAAGVVRYFMKSNGTLQDLSGTIGQYWKDSPARYILNAGLKTLTWSNLSGKGKTAVNSSLKALGVARSAANQRLFIAAMNGSKHAAKVLKQKRKH